MGRISFGEFVLDGDQDKPAGLVSLTLDRSVVVGPLNMAAAFAGGGTSIPILGCVMLDTEGDVLRITATDRDKWIVQSLRLQTNMESFCLCIAAPFAELVRRLPDGAAIQRLHEVIRDQGLGTIEAGAS